MTTRRPLVHQGGQLAELPAGDQLPLASFGAVLAAIGALALAPDSVLIVDDAGAPSQATATADGQVLKRAGGSLSFAALSKSDIGLSAVENTALSTWSGSTNLTTAGNLTVASLTVSDLPNGLIPYSLNGRHWSDSRLSFASGQLRLGSNVSAGDLVLNGPSGSSRRAIWQTAGVSRWIGGLTGAESAGNAGSDYLFTAYDDAGSRISDVLKIVRAASGAFTIYRPLSISALSNGRIPYQAGGVLADSANLQFDGAALTAYQLRASGGIQELVQAVRPSSSVGLVWGYDWVAQNAALALTTYARLQARIDASTAGAETGKLLAWAMVNGSLTQVAEISSSGISTIGGLKTAGIERISSTGSAALSSATLSGKLSLQGAWAAGQLAIGKLDESGRLALHRGSDGGEVFGFGFLASATETQEVRSQHSGGGGFYTWHTNVGSVVAERMRLQNDGRLKLSILAGSDSRALVADSDGGVVAQDAAAFRATIGVTAATLSGFSAVNAGIQATDSILLAFGKTQGQLAARENYLGNPAISGYLLSSSSAGTRSWVAPYAHPATHPWSVFDPRQNAVTDFDRADVGFWIARAASTVANRPANWTNVVHFGNGADSFQLAGSYDATESFYARRRNDTAGTWSTWRQLWHTGNLAFGTGTSNMARGDHLHDGRYAQLGGSDFTGPITGTTAFFNSIDSYQSTTGYSYANAFGITATNRPHFYISRSNGEGSGAFDSLRFGLAEPYNLPFEIWQSVSGNVQNRIYAHGKIFSEAADLGAASASSLTLASAVYAVGQALLVEGRMQNGGLASVPYARWGVEIADSAIGAHKGFFRVETADGYDGSLVLAAYLFGERYVNQYLGVRNGLQLGATRDTGFSLYQDAINGQTSFVLGYGSTSALSIPSSNQVNINLGAGSTPANASTPAGWVVVRVAGVSRRIPYYA